MAKALKMSVKDILSQSTSDFGKLFNSKTGNVKLGRQELSALASAANKRISRIEKAGVKYATGLDVGAYGPNGERYSIKDVKTAGDAQRMFANLQQFFRAKTSTVRGAREQAKRLPDDYANMSDDERKTFWEAYRRFREAGGQIYDSNKILQNIRTKYESTTDVDTATQQFFDNEVDFIPEELTDTDNNPFNII